MIDLPQQTESDVRRFSMLKGELSKAGLRSLS
jgi:hypothetical protein